MTEFSLTLVLLLAGAGFGIGILAAMLGIGGGILQVPILFSIMTRNGTAPDEAMRVAVATSLGIMVFTSMSAGFGHFQRKNYIEGTLLPLSLAGCVGSICGGYFGLSIHASSLKVIFGICLAALAVRMFLKKKPGEKRNKAFSSWPAIVFGGAFSGFFSALLGVGGGALLVPYLVVGMGHGVHKATGTSSIYIIFVALTGGLLYAIEGGASGGPGLFGFVNMPFIACMAPGTIMGGYLGARHLQGRVNDLALRRGLAALLIIVAVRMAFA